MAILSLCEIPTGLEGYRYKGAIDNWSDYPYRPNEVVVTQIRDHLEMPQSGLLVSTGTHRSLWDLILCHRKCGNNCQGLAVIDINPLACAYIHFLVACSVGSATREEFCEFTQPIGKSDYMTAMVSLRSVVDKILEKINSKPDYPINLKGFYQKNLTEFGAAYFGVLRNSNEFSAPGREYENWRSLRELFPVNPFDIEEDFKILKQYADQARISAFVRDIGDLTFLQQAGHTISVVDMSNIGYHKTVALSPLTQRCRMIWTVIYPEPKEGETIYHSCDYHPLPQKQQEELSRLITKLELQREEMSRTTPDAIRAYLFRQFTQYDPPCCHPASQLQELRALEERVGSST